MKSLLSEAWRLEPFVPPFAFSAFFSPEDTLLCVCAAESARDLVRDSSDPGRGLRIAELTSGSGLVGLHLLREAGGERRGGVGGPTLLGLDIDERAAVIAAQNARTLDLANRARFAVSDLWSGDTVDLLRAERPQVLVCNPPYVPEPPGKTMQIEAGAGAHGTAHLLRTLELTRELRPEALALSWCSLSDPVGIVTAAADAGYDLTDLFVAAIADGEYSGSVQGYLRDLRDCYISEQAETLAMLASDGAARFGYLLFAGAFVGRGMRDAGHRKREAGTFVRQLCEQFEREGLSGLACELPADGPLGVHRYILDRWDEIQLRVMLHGVPARPALSRS